MTIRLGYCSRGSALLISLVLISIAAVVLVATFTRVRVSSGIVQSVADRGTASLMGNEAENAAIASLRAHTIATVGTPSTWLSRPGEIITLTTNPGSGEIETTAHALHSGLAINYSEGINLNAARISIPGQTLISGDSSVDLPVRWIYVRQDGSRSVGSPGAYSPSNPLVGRFAYWTDDESTKLNTNLASSRDASRPASDPRQISLRPLSSSNDLLLADAIELARDVGGPFQTPLDTRRAAQNEQQAADLDAARLLITHYNHSQESTFFNEPKIALTTDSTLAGGRRYIDLTDIPATVELLNDYLTRTDWPIAPGESFREKFHPADPDRITQLSLDIIEYVRAKEAPATIENLGITIPIRGSMTGDTFVVNGSTGSANAFRGLNRGPRITELAIWRAETLNPVGSRAFRIFIEVHLPLNGGLESIDLTRLGRFERLRNDSTTRVQIQANECWPDSILPAGGYRVISWIQNITLPASVAAEWEAGTARLRPALFEPSANYPNSTAQAIDFAPMESVPVGTATATVAVPVTTGPPGSTTATIVDGLNQITRSIEVDDPYLNGQSSAWELNTTSPTFGTTNSIRSVGGPAQTTSPEQDMDSSGRITDVGVVLPPPAGLAGNLRGRVESIAELGHIHTGVQSAATGQPGTPWRTLRLQPRHPDAVASGTLPDWALLDIFTLPKESTVDPLTHPFDGAAGGKINLNSRIQPFAGMLTRSLPMEALLSDLTDLPSSFDKATVAANLIERIPSSTAIAEGQFLDQGTNAVYSHPAEAVEVAGVADQGEASEEVLKQVLDHLSVSGNVFTIFTVGQAIVQSPNGDLTVRGEDRRMTMVERREESPGNVTFRTILSKPLNL